MLLIFWLIVCFCEATKFISDVYPKSIPKYNVRLDTFTNKPVETGLIHLLKDKQPLIKFRKHLQCASIEPNINFNNGAISLYRLAPHKAHSIKVMCSWFEKHCRYNWKACSQAIPEYESKNYSEVDKTNGFFLNDYANGALLRVIKGELYYDWPWGVERLNNYEAFGRIAPIVSKVLQKISDIGDSVFFVGGDPASVELRAMIPILSFTAREEFIDFLWPWYELWVEAFDDYRLMYESKIFNYHDLQLRKNATSYVEWNKKLPKAAFYSTYQEHRQFMCNIGALHPDLIDSQCVEYEPTSTIDNKLPPYNLTAPYVQYHPGRYKFVVVPLGIQPWVGLSTSSRIGRILLYSGAVVIMNRSSVRYHFSAQFLPRLQYVPISFSGADLLEKVQWLLAHDDLAQQIAENGRNFARSYLRLEDHYCYGAAVLETFAKLGSMTDATKVTWNPQRANFSEWKTVMYALHQLDSFTVK